MMTTSAQSSKLYLQYSFFMDCNGTLFPCDISGNLFLQTVNMEKLYSQIQCIKLSYAISNTTIIIDNTSYNLRVIPVDASSENFKENFVNYMDVQYTIILQNQSIFSDLIQALNRVNFQESSFEKILDSYSDGIFITAVDGTAIYLNRNYEMLSGMEREQIIGRKVQEMKSVGYFNPLVTPTILKTNQIVTVFQRFKTNRWAIITGIPICNNIGEPVIILICISPLEQHDLVKSSSYSAESSDPIPLQLYEENTIDVIAESREMKHALQDAFKIASYDVHVLILGDSGTGKEVVATVIHTSSKRNHQSFVKINCSSFSSTLIESELFGYEGGSFTGALNKGKQGLFEIANRGTILLDEIGEMPIDLQAKLLRVLESGEIYRVGGTKPIKVNARLIASTNRDLRKMVAQGTFRKDLYYRLNVVTIHIPDLSERREDIVPLLLHFLYMFNKKYSANKKFSSQLLKQLEGYSWPGNVRELKNIVERLIIMCIDDLLLPKHVFNKYLSLEDEQCNTEEIIVNGILKLSDAVSTVERIIVTRALNKVKNTRKAAELLGVSQSTIMRKIKDYDIQTKEC